MASASPEQRERFIRIFVKKSILVLRLAMLLCFQNFTFRGFADVTFFDLATCLSVVGGWAMNQGHQLLGGLCLQQLCNQGNVPVVVHMYNPLVSDHYVAAFLRRHCKEVKGGTHVLDEEGTWTVSGGFWSLSRQWMGLWGGGPPSGCLHYGATQGIPGVPRAASEVLEVWGCWGEEVKEGQEEEMAPPADREEGESSQLEWGDSAVQRCLCAFRRVPVGQ